MKKIVENLYERTQHLLNESIADEVAELLGTDVDQITNAIENLDFADYLELGNAVSLGDKELAQQILGVDTSMDELTAFDADDDDDLNDDGVDLIDQLEGDDEENDWYELDDDPLDESDNAYGGSGGDNSFSAAQPKKEVDIEDDEGEDQDEEQDETSSSAGELPALYPNAMKAARSKPATATANLSPNEKAENMKRMQDLEKGDEVYVLGVDGKPKKATYKGAVDSSQEKFLANVRPKEGQAQMKDRRVSYSNILSPKELAREAIEAPEYSGATAEVVANAIWRRIQSRHLDLIDKYGIDAVTGIVKEVGNYHAGAEELGSSDISIMVRQVIEELASEYPNAGCESCDGVGLDAWGDRCPECYGNDRVEFSEERMRRLAGLPVRETASGGATGAGAIASAPTAVGDLQRRDASIYPAKPQPKTRKKSKKGDGLGRGKKT